MVEVKEKLCKYLNEVLKVMEVNDSFFLDNLVKLIDINDSFVNFLSYYEFDQVTLENKLTSFDVCMIARDFILNFCPNYLDMFDKLINSGQLDFSFDSEYDDSYFQRINSSISIININREFNYNDVVALIHEFIHYTNGYDKSSINRYVLTEFFSIYFETMCIKYLIDKGINKDEIGYADRLQTTYNKALNMYFYEMILASYYNFGCIDYDMTYKYIGKIKKTGFDDEIIHLLKFFERYKSSKKDDADGKLEEMCSENFCSDYRYIFGTLLAFYAYEYCDVQKIIYLNDHINDYEYSSISIIDILKKIGVDFDNDFLGCCFGSIEDYMNLFNIGLKR